MYGVAPPKTKLLLSILGREFVGHDGKLGHLINLNESDSYGTFPTWYMTERGEGATLHDVKSTVAQLIAKDDSVLRERDLLGRSPLHLACSIHSPGQLDVVKALCSSKSANVNTFDPKCRTPLHHMLSPFNLEYHSTFPGHGESLIEVIKFLLKVGANVNAADMNGVSPLHMALDFHHAGFAGRLEELPAILRILKDAGADTDKIVYTESFSLGAWKYIRSSLSMLHLACRMNGAKSLDAIKFLVDLSPERVNSPDSLGRTPLHIAIMAMCRVPNDTLRVRDMIFSSESGFVIEKIEVLLSFGADVNAEDADGMSPLLTAIELFNYEHSVDIIKILLSRGAVATRQDRENTTPLHLACQYFDRSLPDLLPWFIKAGARLDVPDYKLYMPFHYALHKQCCSLTTLRSLVDAGANVMAVDESNNNCIHIVCSHRHYNIRCVVKFLVSKGCNVNEVNRHGNTPLLHLLQSDYNAEAVQALIDSGADCKFINRESISPLHLVCRSLAPSKGSLEIVKALIAGGTNVNAQDRSLSTALFYAVNDQRTVDKEVVLTLLLAGANPNIVNELNIAPLHLVSSYGNHCLAKMLIAFGASVNVLNVDGNTPLHEAACARTGSARTCQILVDAGANVQALNSNNCTPFMLTDLWNSSSFRFLVPHLAQLCYAGKHPLSELEENYMKCSPTLMKYYSDCFSCVERMVSCRLGGSKITLWNFLLAPPVEARGYTRNPRILEDLYRLAEQCSGFQQIIKDKVADCQHFFGLNQTCLLALQKTFPDTKIPLIVSEKIISYLNEFEMECLNCAVFQR